MALSADQRERYARHLLLAEIGEAQQVQLCDARVVYAPGADRDAVDVAADYLKRAGVREVVRGAARPQDTPRAAPSSMDVERVSGRPELRVAAAAVLGAFEAVEALKQCAGVGEPADFPPELSFTEVLP